MTNDALNPARILGIDPCSRGFGFAVLEGQRLIDWGVARIYSKNHEEFIVRVDAMIRRYRPGVIALEDFASSRRSERARMYIRVALDYSQSRGIKCKLSTQQYLRATLSVPAPSRKHDVARAIVALFPELETTLPSPRKAWQTEDDRMNVFDAVGFALCCADQRS